MKKMGNTLTTADKLTRARDLLKQALTDETLTLPNGQFMVEELTRAIDALPSSPPPTPTNAPA